MTATRDARTGLGPGVGERLAALLPADGVVAASGSLASATAVAPSFDPIALYAAAVEAGLEAALWLRPSEGTAFVGIGRAWAVDPAGDRRFHDAEGAWRELLAGAHVDRPADATPGAGPVLLGAMGFTGRDPAAEDAWGPFGASSLVLPELLFTVTPLGAFVTASIVDGDADGARCLDARWARLTDRARELRPSPNGIVAMPVFAPLRTSEEQPGHDEWRRLVGMYAGAVGRGRIDKVVLARRVGLRSPVELDVPNALRRLAASAPESTTYAFRRDGRTFLGATPERLVRTEGRTFRTVAVAGTIRRGADAAEDAELARRLLASEKDREEHAIVVDAIRDLLTPVADSLTIAPEPGVMTLRFVQHLVTEITGTVPEGVGCSRSGSGSTRRRPSAATRATSHWR